MNNPSAYFNQILNYKDGATTDTLRMLTDVVAKNNFRNGYPISGVYRYPVLDLAGNTLFIGQAWVNESSSELVHNMGAIHMNGSSVIQYLHNRNPNTVYYDMIFSGSAEKVLDNNTFDIDGDVTINNTTLNGGGRDHYVAGDWNNTNGTYTHWRNTYFDGVNQNIDACEFWTTIFTGTGTKTLDGNIRVNGGLRIDDAVTLDVSPSNYSIDVQYWWDNDSTGSFEPRNGTVTFVGTPQSNIYSGGTAVGKQFYNVKFDKASQGVVGRLYVNDIHVQNDLTIEVGRLITDNQNVFIGGSFVNEDEFQQNSATNKVDFIGTSGTHTIKSNSGGNNDYRHIEFNAPGATYQLSNDLSIRSGYDIIINDGKFDLNNNSLSTFGAGGDLTINGGELEIDSIASLNLGGSATLLNAGGILRIVGESTGLAQVQQSEAANITIQQTSGSLFAKYYSISGTSGNGVDVQGGTIDLNHCFSNGTFSSGTGNAYLTIANTIDLTGCDTAKRVTFNPGPTYNVSRTAGTGELVFQNPAGALNGEDNDEDDADPGTLIKWDYPDGFYWDGGASTANWNDANNWTTDIVPTASSIVYLEHTNGGVAGAYTVNINTTDAICEDLIIDTEGGAAITLNVNGADLNVLNDVAVGVGATFAHVDNTDTIYVAGSWNNSGTFNEGTGTVIFNGASGTHSIVTTGTADPFYGLKVVADGATYELSNDIGIDGLFTLDSGIFSVGAASNAIYASGDWDVNFGGTFDPVNGTVYFDNSGAQSIAGYTFYNFSTTGSGTKTLAQGCTVDGRVHIGSGTVLDAGTNNLTVNGNWRNDAGATGFTQSGSAGVIFNGDNNQIIGETSGLKTAFNNVYIQGTGDYVQVYRDMDVAGNLIISRNTYIYNGYFVTGTPSGAMTHSTGILILYGISPNTNFPTNFGTYNLAGGRVDYRADGDQDIYPAPYHDLLVYSQSGGVPCTKTALGDFSAYTFWVNDNETTLDVDGYTFTLSEHWHHATAAPQPVWGATGTLIHDGGYWNIDADLNSFNNVDLRGSSWKRFLTNTTFTGNLTAQSGIYIDQNTFTMNCTSAGKSLTLSAESRLYSAVAQADGVAFPTGFTNYDLDIDSRVYLDGTTDQDIHDAPIYGYLYLYNSGNAELSGDLDVENSFYMNSASTLVDNDFNLNLAGYDNDIRTYTPGTASTLTLDGGDQRLYDGGSGTQTIDMNNLVIGGSDTKQFYWDSYHINGDLLLEEDVTVHVTRPIYVKGNFTNDNGYYNQTANVLYFNGASGSQTVDPGIDNDIYGIHFQDGSGGSGNTITIISSGLDVNNGTFTIDVNTTANMGALTHTIASATITNNGTWTTTNANLTFDRTGNQTIPGLTAQDIVIDGTGTKYLTGDWSIDDLTWNTNAGLDVNSTNNDITLTGNWNNTLGTFNRREGVVYFESNSSSDKTIATNSQWFEKVKFNQSLNSVRTYKIIDDMRVEDSLVIGDKATLDLESLSLYVGNNDAGDPNGEVLYVESGGTLDVDPGASLFINSYDNGSDPQLKVEGRLKLVGSTTNQATLTTFDHRRGLDVDVTGSGVIEARYYSVSNLNNDGIKVRATASIDLTNNLSDGSFTAMPVGGAGPKYYLWLECPAPPSTIDNVAFNLSGTPVIGTHYNVYRPDGTPTTVTFDGIISGTLAGETYEDDPTQINSSISRIEWPSVTQVYWTGNVSTEWDDSLNWSPNITPDSTVDAIIPLVALNQPIIGTIDASCRDLILTDGFLRMDAGFDLTVYNDVTLGTGVDAAVVAVLNNTSEIEVRGNWTRGQNAIFTHGNSTVRFTKATGAATISPRSSAFYNLDINVGGSLSYDQVGSTPLTIEGLFSISSGTFTQADNWHTIHFEGDIDGSGGTFDVSRTGHHYLKGVNQSVRQIDFYRLWVDNSGTATVYDTLNVAERTYALTGSSLASDATAQIIFNNNVDLDAGSTFNDGGATHIFNGTYWYGDGTFTANTGTISFERNNWMVVSPGKFNNWNITHNTRLDGNVDMTGNLTVFDADINFQVNCQTFKINNTSGTGTFDLGAGEVIYVYGADNYPDGFSTYAADETSYSYYYGAVNQTVREAVYGNLWTRESNTKTLEGDIEVKRHLLINDGVTLKAASDTIKVGGHFYNQYLGEFDAGTSTVIMTAQDIERYVYIEENGLTKDFYNLYINSNPTYFIGKGQDDINVLNDLIVQNGRFNANWGNITVGNNLKATGGTFGTTYGGNYILNKPAGTAEIQMNGSVIYNLDVNAGATYTMLDDMGIRNNMDITAGTVDGNGNNLTIQTWGRNFEIYGTYKVGSGGALIMASTSSLNVHNTGTIDIVGSTAQSARITALSGRYNFLVNGTIKAENYLIEYTDLPGLRITNTATIDATNHFSNGTFNNCPNNGACLVVENNQDFSGALNRIENVSFPTIAGGSASNVQKTASSTGVLEFYDAIGNFSGEDYDNDPFSIINWTGTPLLSWIGVEDTDWFNVNNWSASIGPDKVPDSNNFVYITPTAPFQPIIDSGAAECKQLDLPLGATLTLNAPISDNDTDLYISGNFINDGAFIMTSANDTMILKGSWNTGISGSFTSGSGTVILSPYTGITNLGTVYPFYNLEVDALTTTSLISNITVNNDFTINQGTVDLGNSGLDLTVKGNFINNGTLDPNINSQVFLSATSGSKTLKPGLGSFADLEINGGADYTLSSENLYIDRYLYVTAGSLLTNELDLYLGDCSGTDQLVISGSGTLQVDTNSTLYMGTSASLNVNSGGTIRLVGTNQTNKPSVTRQCTGDYAFQINTGGTLHARYALFEYMNNYGINIANGGVVDLTNNFSYCTFQNGASTGARIRYEGAQLLSGVNRILLARFNDSPGGGRANVYRASSAAGDMEFKFAVGDLSGEDYDNDVHDKIIWQAEVVWTGNNDTDWEGLGNWEDGIVGESFGPSKFVDVLIPDVSGASGNFPIISSTSSANTGEANRVEVQSGASLTVNANMNLCANDSVINDGTIVFANGTGTLTSRGSIANDGDFTFNGDTIDIEEDLVNTSNFNLGANAYFEVGGSWNSTGTLTAGSGSLVNFVAPSGAQTITNTTGAFCGLMINSAAPSSATFTTGSILDINCDIDIMKGSLVAAHNINLAGDFTNTAGLTGFDPGTYTVEFDGSSSNQVITNPTSFYNIEVTNSSPFQVMPSASNDLDVNGFLNIDVGATLNSNNKDISIAGNWSNNGTFIEGTRTVTFDGSGIQVISNATNAETFYDLVINNTGTVRPDASMVINTTRDLIIEDNSGASHFDLATNTNTVNVGRDWFNQMGTAGFSEAGSTVIMNGTSSVQKITSNDASETFHHLIIAHSGAFDVRPNPGTDLDVDGDLTINAGAILNVDAFEIDVNLAGQWDNNNGAAGFVQGAGTETVTFDGSVDQFVSSTAATETFNHLVIANTGTAQVKSDASTTFDIDGDLTINADGELNPENRDVTSAGNWTNNNGADGYVQDTETVIFDGNSNTSFSNTTTEAFYNMNVANSGNTINVTSGNITVENQLQYSSAGYININNQTFTIEDWDDGDIVNLGTNLDRTIVLGSSGTMAIQGINPGDTGVFNVALGSSATDYARVDVGNNDAANVDFTVQLCDYVNAAGTCSGGTAFTNDLVDYTWNVTSPSTDAYVNFYWDASKEMPGFTRTNAVVSHHNGSEWEYISGIFSAPNFAGSVYSLGTTTSSFSPFGINNAGGPLPVELIAFQAKVNESEQVEVTWSTATEINNDYFEVQRSKDAIHFETIQQVQGAGNSNMILNYKSMDNDPYSGLSYYRLKQVDYDGTTAFSQIESVNIFKTNLNTSNPEFIMYPNPSRGDFFTVETTVPYASNKEVFVVVTDVNGKEFYSKVVITDQDGNFTTVVDPYQRIPAGIYVVMGASGKEIYSDILIVE